MKNNNVKLFVCPMTQNIIDSVIELNNDKIGFIPTRRQIDFDGGYVNNWSTKDFFTYLSDKKCELITERDHAGSNQGNREDDGKDSYSFDSNYFDLIHIDPWKKFNNFDEGMYQTISNIEFIKDINSNIRFEIGTEEVIKKFSLEEMEKLLINCKQYNVEYFVIQSGVKIDLLLRKNIGNFDINQLKQMIELCKKYNVKSKEHNGDYLTDEQFFIRYLNGVDAINIGPELAQIETEIILNNINESELNNFYDICLKSNRWVRWVDENFDKEDKRKLIMICGHYNRNKIKVDKNLDEYIKSEIKNKINNILKYAK